jgi:hypothetical protein
MKWPVPKYDRRFRPTPAQLDLIRRRTLGFLHHGLHRPLDVLLAEAYLQGIRDAVDAHDDAPGDVA